MNPIKLFFSFTGRITRLAYWLGNIALTIPVYAVMYMVKPEIFTAALEPENLELQRIAAEPSWPLTLTIVLFMIPYTAVMVKRFNDRNRPYWLGFAIGGIYALVSVAMYSGLLGTTPPIAADTPPELTNEMIAIMVFGLIAGLASLWLIIDLGFLRGTKGPNRYGPDPKEKAV